MISELRTPHIAKARMQPFCHTRMSFCVLPITIGLPVVPLEQ
jgi:hypothetical protein